MQGRVAVDYPVYRGRSEHNSHHVVLHYLNGRWLLAGLQDKAQPLDVRCKKCSDLYSNFSRSELEICSACRVSNGCPNHHSSTRAFIQISNAIRQSAVFSESPDMYMATKYCRGDSFKQGLIWNNNTVSFLYLALSLEEPESPFLFLCYIFNENRCNDHRADTPCYCKLRLAIPSANWTNCKHANFLTVVKRFCRVDLTIYQSSSGIILGRV